METKCAACGAAPKDLRMSEDGSLLCDPCFTELTGRKTSETIEIKTSDAALPGVPDNPSAALVYVIGWFVFAFTFFAMIASLGSGRGDVVLSTISCAAGFIGSVLLWILGALLDISGTLKKRLDKPR